MKVYFARPEFSAASNFEDNVIENICAEFKSSSCVDKFKLSSSAESADLILFMETPNWKPRSHIENLCKEPLLQRYAHKLLTYNYQDGFAGFLDGIYVMTDKKRFVQGRHKSWSTLWPHNELIYTIDDNEIENSSVDHLCSFRGSISSTLRKQIANHLQEKQIPGFSFNTVNKWYDHQNDEKLLYIREILQSRFVLCPRGITPYTPRFFETMALGRVPVLLADNWVPPENLDIDSVAIRIHERDFSHLEDIIRSKEDDAIEMGHNGRKYWKTYFSKNIRLESLLDVAVSCLEDRDHSPDFAEYVNRWKSFSFLWANEWTIMQRGVNKIKDKLSIPR